MHDGKQPEVIALERQTQTAELLADLLGGGQTIFKSASLSYDIYASMFECSGC